MKKAKKRCFKAQVVIRSKSDKVPDFGLGKGVLATQEIEFVDDGRGFKSPMFAVVLMEHEDRLIKEAVEVRWKEVKGK